MGKYLLLARSLELARVIPLIWGGYPPVEVCESRGGSARGMSPNEGNMDVGYST